MKYEIIEKITNTLVSKFNDGERALLAFNELIKQNGNKYKLKINGGNQNGIV